MTRTTITVGAATAVLAVTLALGIGAPASAAADQEQADAAIAAFTEQVTGAGFESTGPSEVGDVLDLRPSDDPEDAAGACLGDLAQHVTEDGTFVGQTAWAMSDSFALTAEQETTDPMAIPAYDEVAAAVTVVDDTAGITAVVDAFAGDELIDCLIAATEIPPSSDGPTATVTVDNEDVDLGDQAVVVTISSTFPFDDGEMTYTANLGLARVDRALAMVLYSSTGEPLSDLTAADVLATMVDALDG